MPGNVVELEGGGALFAPFVGDRIDSFVHLAKDGLLFGVRKMFAVLSFSR